jgi:hypothetical protein
MWHFDHFPIPGEANQIYVLRETMWDGNIVTRFFRTAGEEWEVYGSAVEFIVEH